MLVTITSIELRSPLKFFVFTGIVLKVFRQLKASPCKGYRTTGGLLKHFTLSAWENDTQMNTFSRNAEHLAAMKQSATIAKEIRVYTFETEALPDWQFAKKLLIEKGKVLSF